MLDVLDMLDMLDMLDVLDVLDMLDMLDVLDVLDMLDMLDVLDMLRARVVTTAITWEPERRTLRVRFQPTPGRVAEDVIAEVLRELLASGARVCALGKGRSLEQRYLEQATPPTPVSGP